MMFNLSLSLSLSLSSSLLHCILLGHGLMGGRAATAKTHPGSKTRVAKRKAKTGEGRLKQPSAIVEHAK